MAKIAEVQEVSRTKLRPYERNSKIHSQDQVERIAESIRVFGFLSPCLIDRDYNIIAGHGRVLAAEKLGMETVPCVFIEGLTDEQRRAYIIADNRLTELAAWDDELLHSELAELADLDFDVSVTGFDIDLEMDEPEEITEDEFSEDVETRCKKGDIWQLGDHRLICGDSTDEGAIRVLMDGEEADLVFTDPPWNVNYGAVDKGNAQGYKPRTILNDCMETEEFKEFMSSVFRVMNAVSKPGAMTYVVMSAQEWGNLMLTLAENDYHWSSTIIWAKDTLVLSRKDYHTQYEPIWYGWKEGVRLHPLTDRKQSDVWNIARPKRSDLHPTTKPVELVARAIQNSSKKNDVILDLFGGSGTTLIASEQTGRRCYMSELDPHYCDVIINRWETLTGREGVLLNG